MGPHSLVPTSDPASSRRCFQTESHGSKKSIIPSEQPSASLSSTGLWGSAAEADANPLSGLTTRS
jgi:hypothetical protein